MADTKISALSAASSLADADVLAIVNGGASKKVDLSTLTTYFESRARVHNAAVANQTLSSGLTYITNSNLLVPNGRLQAKSKVKYEVTLTKAGAGTGTPVFEIRYGTAGTTADNQRCQFTWPAANTAVADEMRVEIDLTFRAVGSGTTAVIEGNLTAVHELTTTGFGGTGLGSVIMMNTLGSGFDSTPSGSIIGLVINAGTSASWTLRQCKGVLENLA